MNTAVVEKAVEATPAEPDLIDRIAQALPDEVRADYYRELLHCRSLPDSDEMLRLLRAMQFLVLLIEQAPSRVAEERVRLEKLLATALSNMGKINVASESYHISLEKKLRALPADVAERISPQAVADKINERLRYEFEQTTIPQTAESLGEISNRMKGVSSEFAATVDGLAHSYRGAAEDARAAVASIKTEVTEATEAAARFTKHVSDTFSKAHRWMLVMYAGGALVIGLAGGMMLERSLIGPGVEKTPAVQQAQQPAQETPAAPKAVTKQ
jgi:hypothetical protein